MLNDVGVPQEVLPPPNITNQPVQDDNTVPQLLLDEQKNYDDIVNLLKYGVELDVIANVKGTTVEELVAFMHLKSISTPPVGDIQNVPPPPEEVDFSPRQLLDDDGSVKKRKHSWKREDFPTQKSDGGDFFCADCKISSITYHCKGCGRKCWKFCADCYQRPDRRDGEICYYSNHHQCFKMTNESTKKRRRPWKKKDFPRDNLGVYYCLDCKQSNTKRLCGCGRDCWKFCDSCGGYYSKHHFPCEMERRVMEQVLEEEDTEPPMKKQKLD